MPAEFPTVDLGPVQHHSFVSDRLAPPAKNDDFGAGNRSEANSDKIRCKQARTSVRMHFALFNCMTDAIPMSLVPSFELALLISAHSLAVVYKYSFNLTTIYNTVNLVKWQEIK